MKNEVFLDFCIWDFEDGGHDKITEHLGIKPIKMYVKGQRIDPKFTRISNRNGWRMSSGLHQFCSFEDHLSSILNIMEPKIDLFKPFCDKYYCEFSCAVYIRYDNDESTPWLHLSKRYNQLVTKLNAEFDLDLYCLPNNP